ncbi:non-ribosomal peptide synthetase [Streptomyces xanthophaeus]|uniref:non-ribosomal peptide synthetase n=1 Tax=Streptomyces xanthophaeus TaxID=67385 RepID=UPI0026472378|nr:non-ribosomal peptide synthetase [Streptomyces xanthophaeus]WKD32121.1 amino acid adenylation domain-containing protein [Streptomyces xanthophaeus]
MSMRTRPSQVGVLPGLITGQAKRTPSETAVVAGSERLSYEQLERRANRLAHHLRGLGAGPGTPVGVCLERGPDLVVVLLGIWRSGAAYLPLDPQHPKERLRWIIEDTGVPLVLTEEGTEHVVRDTAARSVRVDKARAAAAGLPATAPRPGPEPGDDAYVIYTSGSTGRPKGAVVSHAGIANRVLWTVRRHGIGPGDRVLQKTPAGFDAAGWEFFAPLVSGATVVLAPPGAERDPAALVLAVADSRATVLQGVPSVLRLLADEPGWARCTSLRLVFSAGEPLYAEVAQRLLAPLAPGAELWNTYGPTECAIDVTAHRFDRAQSTGPVPIGRPIDGMRTLVLDATGEPVPLGVPGELYAGGPGVARGYPGRPDLTAERFVPDPFGPAGGRLYRTGDRVRWRSDGVLEYLGRLDDQVKVRGVRIEPGEVESALAGHPEIRGAAVAAYDDAAGVRRLAAYVVAGTGLPAAELRGYLRARLPDYLVPSVFVDVPELPLTSSGKVDRAALPAPSAAAPAAEEDELYAAPRTAEERTVARVWSELLGVERIGLHDDFFQRGGYSLLLSKLSGLLRAATGRHIPLGELLATPTVAGQAKLLADHQEDAEPVRRVSRDGLLPLSPAQQRLWLLERMNPGSPEYVVPLFLDVAAGTGQDVVRRALRFLAVRHEVLRTRYATATGEPYQVIDAEPVVELAVAPSPAAGAEGPDDARERVGALAEAEIARGFDLERGPVWRALLLPGSAGSDGLLLLTMHHIACDGWSSAILEREFRAVCAALREGDEPRLPPLALQYADHAVWQHGRLDGEALAREAAHWRNVLHGSTPLELPLDRPRPPVRDARGALVTFTVPGPLGQAVTEAGRQQGATPYMTLLTVFATLLARHTGQWDIPVGAPVAGRLRPETEDVVGCFVNTLVLRCDLTGDPGFEEALRRVRATALDAFAHQELPFEQLVELVQPERDLSRTPLYQVMFDLHDEGLSAAAADGDSAEMLGRSWRTAKADLMLVLHRQADGSLTAALEYATSLFERATVERLAEQFLELLGSVAADPATALSALDLLSAQERDRLLADCRGTAVERWWSCVHELFEVQVRTTPGAIAVTAGGTSGRPPQELTYAELNARANQYAHQLHAMGVTPESVVGVLLDRTPDLVACLLGVWKAGAAYLPLNTDFPADRSGYMLQDSGVGVAVVGQAHLGRLAGVYEGAVLVPDAGDGAGELAARPVADPPRLTTPDHLAYTIYTSGSTGRPKGVKIEHRALANLLFALRDELGSRPGDSWLALTATSFDISGLELHLPLISGGRIVLAEAGLARDGAAVAELVGAHGVTHVQATPSGWRLLLQAGFAHPEITALVGGEALPVQLARELRARVGRLANVYGPTETTIWSMIWEVPPEPDRVAIGRPLQNTTTYVLDEWLSPVPPGVPSELYIGGTGLARGYRNQPDRTAERFVPDPFSDVPGARLYRTGDIARMLPDGVVEYVDRADNQVKIRGHRIEPDEIAAVLREHPGTADAVVVARRTPGGEPWLAAYWVAGEALPGRTAPDAGELAAHCRERLPEYMVPRAFVPLPALPLNPSGKVDRQALPDPGPATEPDPAAGRTPPEGPAQEAMAALWCELLATEGVGSADNFFQLGGTSLLAARLVASVHETFGVTLPLRAVFEQPTVAGLAALVEDEIRAEIAALDDTELTAEIADTAAAHAPQIMNEEHKR